MSEADNEILIQDFTMEEVHIGVKSIPLDSAASIDGFSGAFFINSWLVVKDELLAVVNKFLLFDHFPLYLTHTAIVLIPKKRALESLADSDLSAYV